MPIVSANRLSDGHVVYRDADGGWVEGIAAAALFAVDAAEAAVALAAADVAARRILDPHVVEVEAGEGGIRPRTMRERIRATGPSAGSDVGLAASLLLP